MHGIHIRRHEKSDMKSHNPFRKNIKFVLGSIFTVIEGLMSSVVNFAVFILVFWLLEDNIDLNKIDALTLAVIVCFALRFLFYGIGYTLGQIGGATVSRQIRLFLGDKCKRIPLGRFTSGKAGAYINILTENVAKYERILTHKMPNLIKNGVIALMITAFASILYMPAGLIMLVAVALFIPELMISFQIADNYGGRKAVIYNNTVSSVVNYITGIQTLRAYGMTGVKNEALTRDLKEFSDINYNYEARGIPVSFFFNILQWLTLPAIMIVSKGPWLEEQISSADFMMLCMVPILLARILMSMAIDIFSFKDMYISKEYIVKLANEKEEVQNDEPFVPDNYTIQFRNVFFSYEEGKEVLFHVNLVIPAGKLTAVVGDSGSGKSTIMNLIGKYYEPDQGEILIGNVNIRDYPSEAVLSRIALVDQDVFLFDDTVRENIRHARPEATDQEIEEACRKANCEEFINAMPKGYDTRIGENGSFLSGGERQRLSIARAILRDSPIILLDEATASLDIENELKVKRAIQNLLQENKTIVMIAHTLPIIRNANQIVVVDHGTVAEVGTHDSLIQKQGKYFNMWKA
mgnify:FL=1